LQKAKVLRSYLGWPVVPVEPAEPVKKGIMSDFIFYVQQVKASAGNRTRCSTFLRMDRSLEK
jgi:hypothetical protein